MDADGNKTVERQSWSGNGDNYTKGFTEEISLHNARNLSITAQGKTGVAWQPWITFYNKEGLDIYVEMVLTIEGTTLNQKAVMRQ